MTLRTSVSCHINWVEVLRSTTLIHPHSSPRIVPWQSHSWRSHWSTSHRMALRLKQSYKPELSPCCTDGAWAEVTCSSWETNTWNPGQVDRPIGEGNLGNRSSNRNWSECLGMLKRRVLLMRDSYIDTFMGGLNFGNQHFRGCWSGTGQVLPFATGWKKSEAEQAILRGKFP